MCKKEIFADGIGQIHFAGAMVRFDYVTLMPRPTTPMGRSAPSM